MVTLVTDSPRDYELGDHNDLPVIAGDIIYEGAAVGLDGTGYARPLQAGDIFAGFALRKSDNSTGGIGEKMVTTLTRGSIILDIPGLVIQDVGKPVYAFDDDTFTLTAGTNTLIGSVKRFIANGKAVVQFNIP